MSIAAIKRALHETDPLMVAEGFVALHLHPRSSQRDQLDAHLRHKLFKLAAHTRDGDVVRSIYRHFLDGVSPGKSGSRRRRQAVAELYLALLRPALAVSPPLALIIAEQARSLSRRGTQTFRCASMAARLTADLVRREWPPTRPLKNFLGTKTVSGAKGPLAALVKQARRIRSHARLHGSSTEPEVML